MGDTVSNQKRVVATKGTPHVAKTGGATDVCLNPADGTTAGFSNQVASSLLTPGTSKTLIAGQKIWTAPHQLGPPSEPAHPPHIVGTASGTHIMEAKATSYSTDVFAEGNGVVRTNDSTTQNHGNTAGYVDGGSLSGASAAEEDFLKKQCSIVELTGINEVAGEAADGLSVGTAAKAARPLGWPGKPTPELPYYLEILSGTKVTFKSVRKDVTVPNATNPTCWKGNLHTQWLAKRTGLGDVVAKEVTGKEEYIVDSALTGMFFDILDDAVKARGGLPPALREQKSETKTQLISNTPKPGVTENVNVSSKSSDAVSGVLTSIEAVIAFFLYKVNPVNINVQAISCGASRNAQLRVYPSQKVKVEVTLSDSVSIENQTERQGKGRRALNSAINAIRKIKEVSGYVTKIANLAQKPVKVDFLVETVFSIELNYKECTQEKVGFFGNLYTPSLVGMPWKLSITSPLLIGFSIEFAISLINLVAPALGEAAATALRVIGVKADLVFKASLSVPLSVSIGADEYDFPTQTGVEIGIKPELALWIAVSAGIELIKFGVKFPMSLTVGFFFGDKPKVLLQLQPKGELKTVVFLILLEDSWFEQKWEHEPEDWKINWQGPKIDVITVS